MKEAILAQYSGAVEESSGDESADGGDGEGELDEVRLDTAPDWSNMFANTLHSVTHSNNRDYVKTFCTVQVFSYTFR